MSTTEKRKEPIYIVDNFNFFSTKREAINYLKKKDRSITKEMIDQSVRQEMVNITFDHYDGTFCIDQHFDKSDSALAPIPF